MELPMQACSLFFPKARDTQSVVSLRYTLIQSTSLTEIFAGTKSSEIKVVMRVMTKTSIR